MCIYVCLFVFVCVCACFSLFDSFLVSFVTRSSLLPLELLPLPSLVYGIFPWIHENRLVNGSNRVMETHRLGKKVERVNFSERSVLNVHSHTQRKKKLDVLLVFHISFRWVFLFCLSFCFFSEKSQTLSVSGFDHLKKNI